MVESVADISTATAATDDSEDVIALGDEELPQGKTQTVAVREDEQEEEDEDDETEVEEEEEDDADEDEDDTESESEEEEEEEEEEEASDSDFAEADVSMSTASPSPPRRQSTKPRATGTPLTRATPAKKTPARASRAVLSPSPLVERVRQDSVQPSSDDDIQPVSAKKKR